MLSTSTFIALSAFVFFSACAPKNSCDTLKCKNGGVCASNFCSCPTGYDGAECQNKITERYIGSYAGWTRPTTGGQPTHIDTVDVYVVKEPLTLAIVRRRLPGIIFEGVADVKNSTVIIPDWINGSQTWVINATFKAPTTADPRSTLQLNIVEYENNNKTGTTEFSGLEINP